MQRRPGLRKRLPEVLGVHEGADGALQKPGRCPHGLVLCEGPAAAGAARERSRG